MSSEQQKFVSKAPQLDLSEGPDMLTDFSREAQRQLISARNSLLVLETIPSDKEAVENVFKTFHTIKGLADFLQLHDICCLTQETEGMLDMTRKSILNFEGTVSHLTTQAMDSLQKLLELLDEQIANNGKLENSYLDVAELIAAIREVNQKKSSAPLSTKSVVKSIPTINFEPDHSACSQMEEALKATKGDPTLERGMAEKLTQEFQKTSNELKEAQGKLQERQRELIKERELAIKLTEQAQAEARAKSEYLANMSHEIRTLINAILGFTDLLKSGALNDKQKEHVNTIILSGKMLLGIVNDILDFSKVEAGKLKLEEIEFNLNHIVEEVFKIIRTRLNDKPIALYFNINKDVPQNLVGDPTRLKQIFINLLDNAIKFTEEGAIGLLVSCEGGQKGGEDKQEIRFVVHDTGIGIPEERRQHIFESFTQAESSTTRLYGGTGLGLALCKNFIESMGGHINVESVLGKGSTFNFTIQLATGKAAATDDIPTLTKFAGTDVMLVLGHDITSQRLADACALIKLNPLPVSRSAKQASEFLIAREKEKKPLPKIIFIDTMLPGKEGFMLAYKVRQQERYHHIKLVALSPNVKVEASPDFQKAGFKDFLIKPVIYGEVWDTVQRLLGEKPRKRAVSSEALDRVSCEGLRVLVVEDSLPNQELLKVHFETLGCICDYATNGQEAIDKMRDNDYDICFMDLQMPVMDGLKATKAIRTELKKKVPIVALTAAEVEEEKGHCMDAGMNDYLPKPFDLDELKAKIIKCTKM